MKSVSYKIKKIILEQSRRANVGHIGSCLSIVDIITALYFHILRIPSTNDAERDRFILSKGHSALALYSALFLKGFITEDELNSFCSNNSVFGVHPENHINGVDFSTGSLGHGLLVGTGMALAAKMQKSQRRIFVLLSDAEHNEGSIWEAIMFAAHHKLSNLVAIIDDNGQQAFGYTVNVLNIQPIEEKWKSFGWDAHIVDGHSIEEICGAINNFDFNSGCPHVLIAKTVFGKGVSFMERQIKWHYLPMSEADFKVAQEDIRREVY